MATKLRSGSSELPVLPPEKLDVQMTANVLCFFQFLTSLLRFGSGWSGNHALQRTRPSRYGCNPRVPRAGSLSLGRSTDKKAILNQIINGAMKILPILLQLGLALPVLAQPYYIAPTGSDGNPGTLEKPFATIGRVAARRHLLLAGEVDLQC